MTEAIRTVDVVKRYGRETALDGFNLTVAEGSVYGLLGQNGAGKTTALKILVNLLRADRGEAQVFGQDSRRLTAESLPGLAMFRRIKNRPAG